jgi:hypothetical protein
MKIYTKVVIGPDGRTLEEESYEYHGPLALCGARGSGSAYTSGIIYWGSHQEHKMVIGDREDISTVTVIPPEADYPYFTVTATIRLGGTIVIDSSNLTLVRHTA